MKGNTKLLIKTFANAGEDVYVYVPNYSFENLLPSQRMTETQWNDMTIAAKERAYFDDAMFGKGVYDSKVLFALGGIEKEIWGPTKATHLYGGKDEWVVNLGHVEESGEVTIELTFQDPGVYRLGSLAVTSQPVQQMEAEVDALKQTASERVSNIGVTGSSLSCDVEVEEDSQLVYFSVPYSDGWSATVDGRPAEIQHANVAFMGIMADSGEHRIELRYTTPGLVPGAAISLVGLLALAGVAIYRRKMVKYPRERR